MSTLLKLTETKAQQSRVTLLHHVLEVPAGLGAFRVAPAPRSARSPSRLPSEPLVSPSHHCTPRSPHPLHWPPSLPRPQGEQNRQNPARPEGRPWRPRVPRASEGREPQLLTVGGCRVASAGLTGHVVLQEVEESHPDLLQLPQDLEPPSRAAG